MSALTISTMIEWVEKNIKNSPTLDEMSQYVGYSKFYCSTKFHEYVGVSFKEYITRRKLSLAAVELLSTDKKIIDVALEYGFSSHEAFTHAFSKEYECTPYQLRSGNPNIVYYKKAAVSL